MITMYTLFTLGSVYSGSARHDILNTHAEGIELLYPQQPNNLHNITHNIVTVKPPKLTTSVS